MLEVLDLKKAKVNTHFRLMVYCLCPEQDSNLHTVAGTSPSSWRVYQFHHLGVERSKEKGKRNVLSNFYILLFTFYFLLQSAQNRTRTCTYLRILVPETSASTNSAIWA